MAYEPLGPAAPAASGLLSSLSDRLATPEESRLLQDLRRELAAELSDTPGYPDVVGDARLLRTLRGFDHCLVEAAAAFRAHLRMRRERGLDTVRAQILERWGDRLWELRCEMLPHGETICRYMPEVLVFARTRGGDPVGLGLWGRGRPAAYVREVEAWDEKFLEYYCFMNEARMLLLDQASREQQRLAHFVQVFDLDDWSIYSNADQTWSAFTTEAAGPVGETYHDCNVNFIAIRTTRMARVAYNMIKGWWPRKVTEKVHIFGDDFRGSDYLAGLLGGQTLELLQRKSFAPAPRCQEGRATIKPRQKFELQVDVPNGGRLRWKFSVIHEDKLHKRYCLSGSLPWAAADLEFSLCRAGEEAVLPEAAPQRVGADAVSGCLEHLGVGCGGLGGSVVVLRWDNSHAFFSSKAIRYWVEVDVPPCASAKALTGVEGSEESAKEGRSYLLFTCQLGCVVLLLLLARLASTFEPH